MNFREDLVFYATFIPSSIKSDAFNNDPLAIRSSLVNISPLTKH